MKHDKRWLATAFLLLAIAAGTAAQKPKQERVNQDKVKSGNAQTEKVKTPKANPEKTVPGKVNPGKTVPGKANPEKTNPDKAKPEKTNPDKVKTDKTDPDKAKPEQPKTDSTTYEQKVRDMVSFLEFELNTIGNGGTSARDKDVMITESYTKIFRDAKVQIEDDLDESRDVITNKDTPAYLKDVDYFFTDVKFEFNIEKIEKEENENKKLFYKVSLTRNLKGTTIEGKAVNNTLPRFIEINYNPDDQDLKIVSIYTHEFSEKEALTNWWNQLSFEWQSVFKRKLTLPDSVQLSDIKKVTSIEVLDLSNDRYIQNIEPLGQLTGLQVLNISKTSIADLSPIRNLTELTELDLSDTPIENISVVRYADKVKRLNLNNTLVHDISVVQKMPKLEYLALRKTPVTDFAVLRSLSELKLLDLEATKMSNLGPVETLVNLEELNVSKTLVTDLNAIKGLKNIMTLNIDSTGVIGLISLGKMENLSALSFNYTSISDLHPLQGLPHLKKIYCDHTNVTRPLADAFMASKPEALVIFDSDDLKNWWGALPDAWQKVLSRSAHIGSSPTKDELAKVTNLDSINIAGDTNIQDLMPLKKLQKLRTIIAQKTAIADLIPLGEHADIHFLDISNTPVSDISPLSHFRKMKVLKADHTQITSIEPLAGVERIYADGTSIGDLGVQEFLKTNPATLVVYKTSQLETWWEGLSENWKGVFQPQLSKDPKARRESLHHLIELETLDFKDVDVSDLTPLRIFVRLRELHFSGTAVTDLTPLAGLRSSGSLRSLHATHSPIKILETLRQLPDLEDLDISNTPVDDLKALGSLHNLKQLNCSGTPIRNLRPLETLQTLEYLDCSNTNVRSLDPVANHSLKTVKCYNTSVSTRHIAEFKERNPDCNVIYYR